MRSAQVTGFDHTRVYVSDMERSRAFYEQMLDLRVFAENERQDSDGIRAIFGRESAAVQLVFGRIAGHIVELVKVLDQELPTAAPHQVGVSGFTLTVKDVDDAHAAALANGVEILGPIVEVKGTKIFFIADPDGARIELIEHADGHHVVWPSTEGSASGP